MKMLENSLNHYEKAFAQWLRVNGIDYITLDDTKRKAFGRISLKSFDFLIIKENKKIITEVKGRKFRGKTLEGLKGLQCWITQDDCRSLQKWDRIFDDYEAVFLFAYNIENYYTDLDGRDSFVFDNRKYIFFVIKFKDYIQNLKIRSPKWKTVTLSADDFRKNLIEANNFLNGFKK